MITVTRSKNSDLSSYFETKITYLSLSELRKEVQKVIILDGRKNIRTRYLKIRKFNWPSNPQKYYKDWKGWYDLCGVNKKFLTYQELKEEFQKNVILSKKRQNIKNQYIKMRKPNWPSNPDIYYKEFKSWYDFCGINKKLLTYGQLKEEVRKNKIRSSKQYKKDRKVNWPSRPHVYYKKWTNWSDFLGKYHFDCIKTKLFLTYEQAKKEVLLEGIKTMREYKKNRKSNWPSHPTIYYKEKWNCNDFFGKM